MKLMIPRLRLRARDMQASIWNSPSLAYCSSLEGQSRIPQNYAEGQHLAKPGDGSDYLGYIGELSFLINTNGAETGTHLLSINRYRTPKYFSILIRPALC